MTATGDLTLRFGLGAVPVTYRARIRRFIRSYLGTDQTRVPFGGRDQEIGVLNSWLNDAEAPAHLLVTSPAGRGKSSLLVHWVSGLGPDWRIAFVPISIRYETNRAAVFYHALAAALAEVLDVELPVTPADPAAFYKDTVIDYFDQMEASERRCLVVIDGLDEAAGWRVDTTVLPSEPVTGLKIVVSARLLAGDPGPEAWLRRLGWDAPGTRAEVLVVPRLGRDGIADVLTEMGFPLSSLARDVDLVAELKRLTDGDPLLLEHYVVDLWKKGEQAARLRPGDLSQLQPGFGAYFTTWFDQQREAWQQEGLAVDERTVKAIFAVLACALGPIRLGELASMLRTVHHVEEIVAKDTLYPLRRWVVGDGVKRGYVLSHPKLAEYLKEDYFAGSDAIAATNQGFLLWGQAAVRALGERRTTPTETPLYLLQHYGHHLKRAHAPAELYLPLVTDGWRLAWEELEEVFEGGTEGFAGDVRLAWDACRLGTQDVDDRASSLNRLAGQLRCVLCLSSIWSIGYYVPLPLMTVCVDHNIMSLRQALRHARLRNDPIAITELARRFSEDERSELLAEAIEIVARLPSDDSKRWTLIDLAPRVPVEYLQQLVDIARGIADGEERAAALRALEPSLDGPQCPVSANGARTAAGAIDVVEQARTDAAPEGAPRHAEGHRDDAPTESGRTRDEVVDEQPHSVSRPPRPASAEEQGIEELKNELQEALAVDLETTAVLARIDPIAVALRTALRARTGTEDERAAALRALLKAAGNVDVDDAEIGRYVEAWREHGEGEEKIPPEALLEVLKSLEFSDTELASEFDDLKWYTEQRCEFSEESIDRLYAVLFDALIGWMRDRSERGRAERLLSLAPKLPPDLLAEALTGARSIWEPTKRALALMAFIPHVPAAERPALIEEALSASAEPGGRTFRALKVLANLVPPAQLVEFGEQIQDISTEFKEEFKELVLRVAPDLTAEQVPIAWQIVRAVHSSYAWTALTPAWAVDSATAWVALAPRLPPDMLESALSDAMTIERPKERGDVIGALAPRLPEKLLRQALNAMMLIGDRAELAHALGAAAVCLSGGRGGEVLATALAMTRGLKAASALAKGLVELLPGLAVEQRPAVAAETLQAAIAIEDEEERANVLIALSVHLPKELEGAALRTARAIDTGALRMKALAAMAGRLSREQRTDLLDEASKLAKAMLRARDHPRAWFLDVLDQLSPYFPRTVITRRAEEIEELEDRMAAQLAEAESDARHGDSEGLNRLPQASQDEIAPPPATAGWSGLNINEKDSPLQEFRGFMRELRAKKADLRESIACFVELEQPQRAGVLEKARDAIDAITGFDGLAANMAGLSRLFLLLGRSKRELHSAVPDLVSAIGSLLGIERADLLRFRQVGVQSGSSAAGSDPAQLRTLSRDVLELLWLVHGAEERRADALAALVPHMPAALLLETLAFVQAVGDGPMRAKVLAHFVTHCEGTRREDVVAETFAALEARDESVSAVYSELLDVLTDDDQRDEHIERVSRLAEDAARDRAAAIQTLAPYLETHLLPRLLRAAESVELHPHCERGLAAVAQRLEAADRAAVIARAVTEAKAVKGAELCIASLLELLPCLGPDERQETLIETLQLARSAETEEDIVAGLEVIAPHLTPQLIPEAVQVVTGILDPALRAMGAEALGEHLNEDELRALITPIEADEATTGPTDFDVASPDDGAGSSLAARLDKVAGIEFDQRRAEALTGLVPELPAPLLPRALEIAETIDSLQERTAALAALLPALGGPVQAMTIQKMLEAWPEMRRSTVLQQLASVVKPFADIGTMPLVEEAARSIQDVARWWP